MKKLLRLVITVAVIFLAVRWCSKQFGSVITLPGGSGGTIGSSEKTGSEGSGGWFSPKKQPSGTTSNQDPDIEDLERELGIGKYQGQKPSTQTQTTQTPSTTTTASGPLSFKGIPMTGSLSAFGSELVKAGFKNAGNGTYTGDFAGYSGCKVTPTGNPVQEVRIDFPVISDWDALEKAYDNLQADLTRKYGMDPIVNRNLAVYNLPNGAISLDADVSNQSSWHVILTYKNAVTTTSTGTLGRNPIDDL
ncbi:MAG: hypothetical protein J6P62_12340 [Bacteroidales bacterium]|nr:hypothetical protein [Bacteroidales bacterium]